MAPLPEGAPWRGRLQAFADKSGFRVLFHYFIIYSNNNTKYYDGIVMVLCLLLFSEQINKNAQFRVLHNIMPV